MDARKDRIGEYTAGHPPAWAIAALGRSPPIRPTAQWQKRAAAIGAWRELSGYSDPADPIGPERSPPPSTPGPPGTQALAALGSVDGPDVRGMPDGRLLHLRDTYPIETAWAPRYVGDELRQVRAAAWDARLVGLRAAADARAADRRGDHDEAADQRKLAFGYRALEQAYRQREAVFAQTMADRADWRPGHPRPAPAGRRRRCRAAPPPPRPVLRAAGLGRTRARQRLPACRAHPHPGPAARRDRPVDKGPGRRAPDLRRQARRPAEPDDPVRGSRLRQPGSGVSRLERAPQGADPEAAQARDPALPGILERMMDRDVDWEAADDSRISFRPAPTRSSRCQWRPGPTPTVRPGPQPA